jgi:hypothetical protein
MDRSDVTGSIQAARRCSAGILDDLWLPVRVATESAAGASAATCPV